MGLVNCEDCGKQIASNARVCPYCGRKRTHPFVMGCAIILGIMLFLFMYGIYIEHANGSESLGKIILR